MSSGDGSVRRVARDILVYGSGDVVLRASALITLPIYSRLLGPSEFGVWSFLVALTFLLNVVLMFGGDAAYARYFFAARDQAERAALTSTLLLFVAAASVAVVVLLLPLSGVFARWSFDDGGRAALVALPLAAGPLTVVNTLLGQVLRNDFRAVAFALQNVATAVIGVALSVYLVVVAGLGVRGVLIGGIAAAAAMLPVRLWTARRYLRATFAWPLLRRGLAFGLPLVPAAFAGWVFTVSDRIVLGKLASFREVGLYAVAASIASVLSFLLGPLGQAWSPHAVQAYERDPDAAAAFYGRVLTYILVGFGALAVALTTFGRELVALLTPAEFERASRAIAPLALGAVAFATIQITSAGISLRHRTVYIALLSIAAALFNLGLNVALVPRWGMLASAWTTAFTSLGLTLSYAVVSHRLWRVRYELRKTLWLAVLIVAFTLGAQLLPELDPLAAMPLKVGYCAAFVAALVAARVLGAREARAIGALPLLRQLRS